MLKFYFISVHTANLITLDTHFHLLRIWIENLLDLLISEAKRQSDIASFFKYEIFELQCFLLFS